MAALTAYLTDRIFEILTLKLFHLEELESHIVSLQTMERMNAATEDKPSLLCPSVL